MMWMLLLFGADPTGLQTALESADSAEIIYPMTSKTITLKGDDLKELAKLVEISGEVKKARGVPATPDVVVMVIRKGDSSARYIWLTDNTLIFGENREKLVQFSDRRLGQALRKRIGAPEAPAETPAKALEPPPKRTFHVEAIDKLGVDVAVVGDFVIVAEDKLALFKREGDKLTLMESISIPLTDKFVNPRLAIRGKRVYVASGLWIFVYELRDGKLRLSQRQDGLSSANALEFFGEHLYVICQGKRLDLFTVAADGTLAYVETVTHERMKYATGVAATRRAVYVVCHNHTLLTFKREPDGKLTYANAEVDKINTGAQSVDRGLTFASAVVAVEDRLYILALRGSVSLWRTDGDKPIFVKRWGTETNVSRCTDMALAKDTLWIAAGQSSLIYFLVEHDGQLSGPQKVPGLEEGVTALAAQQDTVYAVGQKLWLVQD